MKFIFIYIIFFHSFLYSNNINIMIDGILNGSNKNSNDEMLLQIDGMNSKNSPNLLILKGLIEPDGEKSYSYFKSYIDDSMDKKYSELAISKISEYYYIRGLYVKSSEWYKKIIMNYPDSDNLEPSINYFLNSLSVSGKLDSAKYYSKILHDKYPKLKFNSKFYNKDNSASTINKNKKNQKLV